MRDPEVDPLAAHSGYCCHPLELVVSHKPSASESRMETKDKHPIPLNDRKPHPLKVLKRSDRTVPSLQASGSAGESVVLGDQ